MFWGQAPDPGAKVQGIRAWPATAEVTQQRQHYGHTVSPRISQLCCFKCAGVTAYLWG